MRYFFSIVGLLLVIFSMLTCNGTNNVQVEANGILLGLTGFLCLAAGALIHVLERILARLPESRN